MSTQCRSSAMQVVFQSQPSTLTSTTTLKPKFVSVTIMYASSLPIIVTVSCETGMPSFSIVRSAMNFPISSVEASTSLLRAYISPPNSLSFVVECPTKKTTSSLNVPLPYSKFSSQSAGALIANTLSPAENSSRISIGSGIDVGTGVEVGREVGVAVGGTVGLGVSVAVGSGVAVSTGVAVGSGVDVGVGTGVGVVVGSGVGVGVGVALGTGVGMGVDVAVGAGATTSLGSPQPEYSCREYVVSDCSSWANRRP